MVYVDKEGTQHEGESDAEERFIERAKARSIESALENLKYYPAAHIGKPEVATIELFINEDIRMHPAAVAHVTIGAYYETYHFETRHAALLFMKEFAPTIESICRSNLIEVDEE